jgi:hypothetical protein
MSAARRAADMRVFHFGRMTDRDAGSVGEYALHIQCPWRLESADGIITGRSDLWEPIDRTDGFSYDNWDYHRDGNLQDQRINQLFDRPSELRVQSVDVHRNGSFTIDLSDEHRLVVFPSGSVGEDWRLFRPGSMQEQDHLVISGGAVE